MTMKGTGEFLGILMSALSILLLVQHAILNVGIAATLQVVLDYYDILISIFFGWLTPFASGLVSYLNSLFLWDLSIEAHWKHVFVIVWLYFISSSRMIWSRNGSWYFTGFGIAWGGVCAFLASVFAGVVGASDISNYVLLVALAIAGVVSFEIGVTLFRAWEEKAKGGHAGLRLSKGLINYILPAVVVGTIAIWVTIGLSNPDFSTRIINPGLLGAALYIVFLSIYWFFRACYSSIFDRNLGESVLKRFSRAGGTFLSKSVFNTVLAVGLLLVTNAGMQFVGL